MSKRPNLTPAGERHRAEDRFARLKLRGDEARSAAAEREDYRKAETDKTERLRALRLAKEAADAAAAKAAARATLVPSVEALESPAKDKPALV